jgi:hypothetical protein
MDDLWREVSTTTSIWLSVVRTGLRLARWAHGLLDEQARHAYRAGWLMSSLEALKIYQRKLIEGADMLLPNSRAELELLHCDFPDASSADVSQSKQDGLSIVYVGSAGASRTIHPFLQAVRELVEEGEVPLGEIQVEFIGQFWERSVIWRKTHRG